MTIPPTRSSPASVSTRSIDLDALAHASARRSRFAVMTSMACFVTATAGLDTGIDEP
jgi:hypothetical protein